jgi:hypothetical protein
MKTYYVYLLTDPRNNHEIFYCGKGTGDRWKSHLGHWSGNGKNNPTENKIKKIQAEGLQPGVMFLHENIVDEDEAYCLEENYIRDHFDKLTNLKIEAKPPSPKGKPGNFKGKKHSEESKRKTSLALKGQKRGPAPQAERIRLQAMAFKSGKDHPGYGKPALNRKVIIELTTNTEFTDQISASKLLKIRQGDIANCLAGRQKSAKGYQFVFKDAK